MSLWRFLTKCSLNTLFSVSFLFFYPLLNCAFHSLPNIILLSYVDLKSAFHSPCNKFLKPGLGPRTVSWGLPRNLPQFSDKPGNLEAVVLDKVDPWTTQLCESTYTQIFVNKYSLPFLPPGSASQIQATRDRKTVFLYSQPQISHCRFPTSDKNVVFHLQFVEFTIRCQGPTVVKFWRSQKLELKVRSVFSIAWGSASLTLQQGC